MKKMSYLQYFAKSKSNCCTKRTYFVVRHVNEFHKKWDQQLHLTRYFHKHTFDKTYVLKIKSSNKYQLKNVLKLVWMYVVRIFVSICSPWNKEKYMFPPFLKSFIRIKLWIYLKLCSKSFSDLIIFPKRGIRVVCTLKFIKFVACKKQVYAHDLGFLWPKAYKKIEWNILGDRK